MANYFLCMCLTRVALPICLTLSIIFRPSMLSAMYLLLLLYLPLVPIPTTRTMGGHTGCYLKIVICISFLTSISQLAFQIVLLSLPPYAHFLNDCEFMERILRHVGFIRLNHLSATHVVQWLSPEIVMLFVSIAVYVLCNKLTAKRPASHSETTTEEGEAREMEAKPKMFGIAVVVGRYVCLASLAIAACLRPSVIGGFYFLVFLGGATWWACYKELRKAFAYVCRVVLVVLFFHICTLYGYQFQWPQEYLNPNSTYARFFGLTPIVSVNCDDPRAIDFNDLEWASYLNPIWLLWLYYVLAIESKLLLMPQPKRKTPPISRLDRTFSGTLTRQFSGRLLRSRANMRLVKSSTAKWQSASRKARVFTKDSLTTERTPLIRRASPSRIYGVSPSRSILQDSTGSVTITTDLPDDIPMQQLGKGTAEEEPEPSSFDNFLFAMDSIMQVLIRSSYIATNITMMAWSITYHSWLTFVLLLWANLLWLLPNQRRAMLRSAPFLVIYAEFLLISAYIYGMNLTEDELPSTVANIKLSQIGFEKILVLPCNSLFVKCLYTTMFWITLRQFMHERKEARQTSALADMVAPLEVTVGTATSAIPVEESKCSIVMKQLGDILKKFLTKFWIWLVTINLFIVAITGDRMTSFRIIYMFLFLFFILTLQLSFRIWRKIMYGFWLIIIGYSMLTLVLVYTYQFDNFPDYWTTYLHIPPEQQLDIGLKSYETKQLFVRLLTPTYFVVTTVIQLHYFHKDFLEITNLKSRRTTIAFEGDPRSEASSAQGGPWETESIKSDTRSTTEIPNINFQSLTDEPVLKYIAHKLKKFLDYLWLFLELHIFKIIFLIAMLLTVYDTCAIHYSIMIFAVIGVTLGRKLQIVSSHLCSIVVSVMLLARMLYQIKYIDHSKWDVYCDNATGTLENSTQYNNAEWLGFYKIHEGRALPSVVKWYIGFITVVTIRVIIDIRQQIWRLSIGTHIPRPFFMFPKVTRGDADKSIRLCLMYLTNYGFYKFGVEVSFMATVALIGTRMDFYACLYGFWLAAMCMMKREQLAKIWNWYLAFIAILIPVQYFMVVGLPPGLCIVFPWEESETLRRMQDWMFLLDTKYPLFAQKLICDIFVLILVARQSIVFRVESRYKGTNPQYPGGSNESIIHKMDEPDFVNPVSDFVTYIRSWLDIFKRGVLQGFIWITLAIVFLAGTNRVNLFSLGYLGGSFIFLWHGSELYLRPISKILRAWNWLLGYNVIVILIKAIFQIWGCIFINEVSACWLLPIFGIGCIKKFGVISPVRAMNDELICTPVSREDIGLAWDGICFGFLIMQRRIFCSYYFFHIIDEIKATTILASRGAELMKELKDKQMAQKVEQEGKILEKIKHKMDRIKATQQKIQGPNYKEITNHFVEEAPIARSPSLSSCTSTSATSEHTAEAGYHTPIDEDEEADEDPAPLTPRAGSLLQTQAPTPCSALMTVSLDGYLEPQRISFSSPPNSELNPRPMSPDESFPVFSPPPYNAAVGESRPRVQRQTSIGPPWMQGSFITPRQSVISYSSRSPQSHHTYSIFPGSRPLKQRKVPTTYKTEDSQEKINRWFAIRSGDYYMFDDLEDEELDLISEKSFIEDELEDDMLPLDTRNMTVTELLSEYCKRDLESLVRRQPPQRRASMPLARQQSYLSTRSHLSAPLPILVRSDKGSPRRGAVTIQEETKTDDIEPIPGSSKQYAEDEMSLLSDEKPVETSGLRDCINFVLFLWKFIESLMNTMTNYINRASRDCRYVLRILSKEKKLLKENTNFRIGLRNSVHIWEPVGSFPDFMKHTSEDSADTTASLGDISPTDSYRRALGADRSTHADGGETVEIDQQPSSLDPIISRQRKDAHVYAEYDRRKASVLTVPEIRILAPSLERGLDDSPCSQLQVNIMEDYETAEMSSADQPPVIRLLHSIWFLVLSNTDVLCYITIFLNQIKSASLLSLPLPLMVFIWGTLTIPRPSKTFWITIIAYTEVIVLIKCLFQFKILDDTGVPGNQPFYPPRIIGIERTKYYATFDLIVLLVVFFHRVMLKTLGLWKSSFVSAASVEDGIYRLEDDDDETLSSKFKPGKSGKIVVGDLILTHYAPVPKRNPQIPTISARRTMLNKIARVTKQFARFLTAEYLVTSPQTKRRVKVRRDNDYLPNLQHRIKRMPRTPYKAPTKLTALKLSSLQSEPIKEEPSVGLDDDVIDSEKLLVKVTTQEVSTFSKMPMVIGLGVKKYFEGTHKFFLDLLDPTSRITVDVYAYMFICDFFNFMVIIFGFSAFGTQQGDGGVSAYLQENRVPIPFLLMLILQFILIIVDRALFLRKYILGKILFQFFQIVGVHIWMFFVLPAITERQFNALLPPQMWYMVKCFYLLLSAYQIRCGYPTRILGNFLCKGFNYANMLLFKIFMAIPFLFELRTIMDWMWTDTSMTIFDWLKMEDIFAHIFLLKCTRHVEAKYPQPRGEKKDVYVKYLMGGACLFAIIAVIWFPLVFFALGNTVGASNIPYDVTVNVRIGSYQPIFSMSAQTNAIYGFSESEYEILTNNYKKNRVALTFLSLYDHGDVAAVKLNTNSTMIWAISPPDIQRMIEEVESDNDIILRFNYVISRTSNTKDPGIITSEIEVTMPAKVNGHTNPDRTTLKTMLIDKADSKTPPVHVSTIFPKFVKVTNRNVASPVHQLMDAEEGENNTLRGFNMRLSRPDPPLTQSSLMWWEIKEDCTGANYVKYISNVPHQDCEYLVMFTFNEKSFPASLSFLSGGGIIGLYTTLVFVASRMIRGFFSEICFKIMYDDMPNVDRILQLSLDIYLVREARELCLEEDLFAKLVFLFRSPETLIKWTRPKEEDENADDPDDEPQQPAIAH